ncbi:MAG: transketolase [Ectothiorhodospiraceae bacterium]|nr:transketolase [Ectothiorhodospiraceae bacterium]
MLVTNTIRTLSMDAVQKADSGHPGTPMALAPVGYTLFDSFMKFNPKNPDWMNRDRFILSAGHACMLQYSLLHICGYDISLEDIKQFRQLHSKCPGHPEYNLTPGVEATTGPLGQGVATSVGMAIAEKWLAANYNRPEYKIFDYNIYAIASDGCMMEGVSSEAASLAGHLGLDNLVWIYDNNRITIEGETDLAFSEDVATRFMAYNWNVLRVGDANDFMFLKRALQIAQEEVDRPTLIIVDSHIAYGSPSKQDTAGAHGSPLGEDEIRATKEYYGWDPDKEFYVPNEIYEYQKKIMERGRDQEREWEELFERYTGDFPKEAEEIRMIRDGRMPTEWDCCLPEFEADEKGLASRKSNSQVLNAIAEKIPWFLGGSADLAPSTKTLIEDEGSFAKGEYKHRNLHFGVREHAMGAIANGMALSGLRPYVSTFLVFSDFMRPSLRLSALMDQPVIYIFTHDSIGLGEDGPTHQPIEHLASLRAIPNVEVIRPADANEVSVLWKHILNLRNRPVALVLTRQGIPTFDREKYASADNALRGAYVLADCEGTPELVLIATGSEVQLCLKAYERLLSEGIKARVVSMPCWSLYEDQDDEYKDSVIPPEVDARVSVEAGSTFGWRRYTGRRGIGSIIGLRDFGASAPVKDVLKEFGLTVDGIVDVAKRTIERSEQRRS